MYSAAYAGLLAAHALAVPLECDGTVGELAGVGGVPRNGAPPVRDLASTRTSRTMLAAITVTTITVAAALSGLCKMPDIASSCRSVSAPTVRAAGCEPVEDRFVFG